MSIQSLGMSNDLPKGGVTCDECGSYCKVYDRRIHYSMARWLISLVRRYEKEPRWYSTRESWSLAINGGTGDIGKLAYWELTEHCENTDSKKRTSGLWRPARQGFAFVHNKIRLPKYARTYKDTLLCLHGMEVSIRDCLGKKFDYGELMQEPLP